MSKGEYDSFVKIMLWMGRGQNPLHEHEQELGLKAQIWKALK